MPFSSAETARSGLRQIPLDASGLAAGSYHCHVQEGQRVSSRLVVVE